MCTCLPAMLQNCVSIARQCRGGRVCRASAQLLHMTFNSQCMCPLKAEQAHDEQRQQSANAASAARPVPNLLAAWGVAPTGPLPARGKPQHKQMGQQKRPATTAVAAHAAVQPNQISLRPAPVNAPTAVKQPEQPDAAVLQPESSSDTSALERSSSAPGTSAATKQAAVLQAMRPQAHASHVARHDTLPSAPSQVASPPSLLTMPEAIQSESDGNAAPSRWQKGQKRAMAALGLASGAKQGWGKRGGADDSYGIAARPKRKRKVC